MGIAAGLNATLSGPPHASTLVLLHGFGCGQAMWRHVAALLQTDHHLLLLDLPGAADTDPALYDPDRHASLDGYAQDVLRVLDELGLTDATIVGHSVAAMIGILAHLAAPAVVTRLVLVAPSARYLNDGDYLGGFEPADINDLLEMMDRNHLGWQAPLSDLVGGGHEQARLELEEGFCRTRPEVARQFAAVTFTGDNRADLPHVTAPTLVLQVRDDAIAPRSAGQYIHDSISGSQLVILETRGHAPHLSDPAGVASAIRKFLNVPARR